MRLLAHAAIHFQVVLVEHVVVFDVIDGEFHNHFFARLHAARGEVAGLVLEEFDHDRRAIPITLSVTGTDNARVIVSLGWQCQLNFHFVNLLCVFCKPLTIKEQTENNQGV